jgi:TolB-like protein/DNA-binding winged helix-turn-helix (wHTH) protein/Tfp pilus assembly protein PilF
MQDPARTLYEFPPDFCLDPVRQVLLRRGERVALTQKAFATLLVLLEQHDRTVDKQELVSRVWQGAAVEENNLNQCISALRKALGEQRNENRFILTVPGVGYRFVAEVRECRVGHESNLGLDDGGHPAARPRGESEPQAPAAVQLANTPTPGSGPYEKVDNSRERHQNKKRWILIVGVAVVLVMVGLSRVLVPSGHRRADASVLASVAVLPFLNLGGNPENDYLGDGFAEELTTALAEIPGLHVAARTSAFQFRGKDEDVRRVGEQLSVGTIIEGSVTRSGDELHVTAQLVSTRDGYHLWSRTYDVPQSQIYAIQQEIVHETVRALGLPAPRLLAHRYTVNPEAHDLYLEGRYYWNKRDLPDMERSAQLFEAAIRKDPNFALAYAGLADTYVVMGGNGQKPLSEVVPRAKPALARALELDPNLGEAHATLALLHSEISGERRGLVPELQRAVELSPGYASAHHWLGLILGAEGRFEEADAELRKAQVLDPLSPMITEGLAENFYYWRRYDDTIAEVQQIRKMGSALGDYVLGRAYVQKAMFHDAISVFSGLRQRDTAPLALTNLAIAYAAAGDKVQARSLLRQATTTRYGYVPPYWIAIAYLHLGEKDNAFEWLQQAYRQNDPMLGSMKVDPMLDPIRSDPRYIDLLGKADLSD